MYDNKINQWLWLSIAVICGAVGLGSAFLLKEVLLDSLDQINLYVAWFVLILVGGFISMPFENRFLWFKGVRAPKYIEMLGAGSMPPITFGLFFGLALGLSAIGIGKWA